MKQGYFQVKYKFIKPFTGQLMNQPTWKLIKIKLLNV